PAAAGDTNIKVASAAPFSAGQKIWLDATSNAEQVTITNVGTAGATGTGLDLAAALTQAHASGRPAYVSLTTPSISNICWTDAQGVLNTSGPNARGSTAPMTLMGLGASFDRQLANAWGQTEGSESRAFMVTGMFGPQTDLDRLPNWGRNLTTTGEDPYLSNQLVAAQINGMQGSGAMSEMKHFVVYNGQSQNANTDITDQGLHELYLTPYEGGFIGGNAAATMCSYQLWRDVSTNPALAKPISTLSLTSPLSPFANSVGNPQTWPLNQSHFSCEQPLSLTNVLRDTWGSQAIVGSDYPATHSSSGILQGEDQEMPTQNGFFSGGNGTSDPTGSTCAYTTGAVNHTPGDAAPCDATDDPVAFVGGIPNHYQGSSATTCAAPISTSGTGAAGGCTVNEAVADGALPLSVFNQSLARILYEEERFGMLGCEPVPTASCSNPGGVNGDRSGTAALPLGGDGQLGTKYGDAAVVEKYSEEGATLLKNDTNALPLTSSDLAGGILVAGSSANHTVADPTNEASTGFIDRDAVNPLQQLKALSGDPGAFTFVPANDPTGQAVGPTASAPADPLSTSNSGAPTGALARTTGPGSPSTDPVIDFTTASSQGQLAPGSYTWTGYIYIPTDDTYTFDIQQSAAVGNANVTLTFDGSPATLTNAANIYGATVPGSPTNAGYTEPGLINRQFAAGSLTGGTYHSITLTFNNDSGNPASFRFAFSRSNGDIADAAAAAAGKSKAIVFVNTGSGVSNNAVSPTGTPYAGHTISAVNALSAANVNLINAVAAANPNTIVVLNNDNPVDTSWIGNVKALLDMWFAGQEGGTSTARILLGQADPSGHTALTWPASRTDTIWGYNEPANGLYPGSTAGQHLDRLNGNAGCSGTGDAGSLPCPAAGGTTESEGIYTGYRYFDKLGITPRFPFGFGLSYTTFAYSGLSVTQTADGGADVTVKVRNTGSVAGADAVQVYVGPPKDAPAGVQFAVRSLAQFGRVELNPGQAKQVTLHIPARQLSYWSEAKQNWVLDAAGRRVSVGDADALAHLPLQTTLKAAPNSITCSDQQFNATTINGNLTIPPGAWCDLVRVTVNGNVSIQGTGVRMSGVTINGNVAASTSDASDPLSSGANTICNSTITGNLQIQGSSHASWQLGTCGTNTIGGDVWITNNSGAGNSLSNTNIHGDLSCSGNADIGGSNNKVGGQRSGQCATL
ncbi:MAG: glycoside hydrolase family 3 C-terminal domain-containing protein, partial [Actinobacteria bacterium]|nr:glycoside hydrolase family 3 C-terminal domain-containing protein [Actinomycetota bacterium]